MSIFPAVRPAVSPAVRGAFEQGSGGGAASIIAGLFAQGQQGFWLPFTDFASLSQDSAGTLPYTALQQPVGRVLDRSGRGNHATQPTSTARGVVSARVNKLTNTDGLATEAAFFDASKAAAGFAADGTTPAWKFTENAANTAHVLALAGVTTANLRHSIYFEAKAQERSQIIVADAGANQSLFNLATGVVTPHASATCSMVDLGGGWWGCTDTRVSLYTTPYIMLAKNGGQGYLGDGVSGLLLSKLQVSVGAPVRFQRVVTATDYDSVGFPKSLSVQVDDFYTCGGGGSTTGFFFSDVLSVVSGSNGMLFDVVDAANAAYRTYVLFNAYNQLIVSFTSGSGTFTYTTTAALTGGAMSSVQLWYDGSLLSIQMGSGTIETFAAVGPNQTGSVIHLYRHKFAAVNYFNGKVTEPIFRVGPPPSAYERGVIRAHQMKKAGMV